jgi:iron(III) transport system permease protein
VRRRLPGYLLLAATLAFFAVFLLYPVLLTLRGGFAAKDGGLTLHHFVAIFGDAALRKGLLASFGVATCVTIATVVIAMPLGVLSARFDFPLKKAFAALVLVPMILPPFVGAIGLHHLLGRFGAVNALLMHLGIVDQGIDFIGRGGFWAIVAIESFNLYPIIYLNVAAAIANLDPALDEAAEGLGAGAWRRFRQITLPLIRPGIFAGATIVFVWSFTELGTPLMFDYQTITPVQIFNGLKEMEAAREPYALTAVMLIAAVSSYVLGKLVFGGRAYATLGKASIHSQPQRLTGAAGLGAALLFTIVTALAILPHAGVVLASLAVEGRWYGTVLPEAWTLTHYGAALSHPDAAGAIRMSLLLATCAMALDVVLGIMIGYVVVRTRLPGRGLIDALAMTPLAVPGLVMAFGYVAMTLRWPFAEGDPLHGAFDVLGAEPNPIALLIIAYAVRRMPYVVRATVAGLQQTPRELEEAAAGLGARPLRILRTVTIPLIAANLVAGGLLAFSFAMLEVSDSLILAQRAEHFPITKAIYVLFARLGDGPAVASALGVWGMALLALTLVGASVMMGKRLGVMFRV